MVRRRFIAETDVITPAQQNFDRHVSASGRASLRRACQFPLVVVGRCVLLILVVDRVLFVASVRLGRESTADGFFLGSLGFAWRH